ncbi:disks large homolog 2-like [Oppia nitens]|uniref:disks large homolog 2-like n=1 Tax=Oppia nitens TaxID=1686743 RepID=UPI0023DAFFC0|nr:disks large homolog 2-like [Oppia nitens]
MDNNLDVDEHWEFEAINLTLDTAGLGISVKGGLDSPDVYDNPSIYVSKIFSDGKAYNDSRLQIGDVILSVNGFPLVDVMHFEAVNAIICAGTDITFYVRRKKCRIYDRIPTPPLQSETPIAPVVDSLIQVKLNKGDKGFGLCISGGRNNQHIKGDNGIFVTRVVDNGVAERDGRICVGDQLIAINECNLEDVTYEEAVNTMRNSSRVSIITVLKK